MLKLKKQIKMKTQNNSKVRSLKEGYGVNGVRLDLTMAHIYSLMALSAECKMAMEVTDSSNPAYNLARQTKGVLDFIIGDIKSPFNEDLWKSDEEIISE